MRPVASSKLVTRPAVELDGYSLMCVSYAKEPFAREMFLELAQNIAKALDVTKELLDLPRNCALDVFCHAFLLAAIEDQTPHGIKQSALCLLHYSSVCRSIFNEFLMERLTWVTRHYIDGSKNEMKELLHVYASWYLAVIQDKGDSDQFMLGTTDQIRRISIRGFFEYCQIAFKLSPMLKCILIMQSNSNSIEAVFANVRNMKRDTPQGFVTAATISNSLEGISVLAGQAKKYTTRRIFQLNCHPQKTLQEEGMTTD